MTVRFLGGVAERRRRFAFGPAPTFKQDFVTGGGGALPQGATFSRGTIGTLYNQSGLVAYAPSNLFTYSTNFTNAIWNPVRSSVPSTFYLAPDGNTTAQKLVEDTTASASHLLNASAATIGANQILSVYAKAGERTQIAIQVGSTASYFDLILGTVITGSTGAITSVGNGWYRCSVYGTNLASTNSFIILSVGGSVIYTGDGVSGAYVWGAQLEQGSNATTYTPTTTAAVYGPRFDYDPGNVLQQNLITTNIASWNLISTALSNNTLQAPDGTYTGASVYVTTTTLAYIDTPMFSSVYWSSLTTITFSVFVKANSISQLMFGIYDSVSNWGTSASAAIISGPGTITNVTGALYSVTGLSTTQWTQVSVTRTGFSAAPLMLIYPNNNTSALAGSSIGVWNAQANFGSTALPYIAATTTAQTVCAPRGLLIEEARTNLLLQSNDFQTSWTPTNITRTLNSTLSPEGVVNGVKIEATTTATGLLLQGAAVAATAATFSVYAKQGTGPTTANSFVIRNNTTATNLVTGTLNYSTGAWTYITGTTGAIITNVGNGWWRVQLYVTTGITSGDLIVGYVGFSGSVLTAGDFLYAYGAQLEAGTFATSYIPTTSATVTRNFDSVSLASIPWFNASAGTFVAQADNLLPTGTNQTICAFSAGSVYSTGNGFLLRETGTGIGTGGNTTSVSVTGSITANVPYKAASTYQGVNFAVTLNGVTPITGTTNDFTGSGTTTLVLGALTTGFVQGMSGHIRSFSYYNYALTNAQLQQVTT